MRIGAAGALEPLQLLAVLHALGHHGELEVLRQRDHRADDGAALARQRLQEAAVDLELVDGEGLQIGQRRVAGAEIVDRQAHAQRARVAHELHRRLHVFHQHALGQLQFQQRGRQAAGAQRAHHFVQEAALAQLARRHVHRHADRLLAMALPGHRVGARAFQHPAAQRHDQAAVFRHRNEFGRRNKAMLGVVPAQQRLGPHHGFGGAVELRLVVHGQLAAAERAAQVAFQRGAALGLHRHGRLELGQAVAAGMLGVVQRGVGIAYQFAHAEAIVREQAHAHAGGGKQLAAAHLERRTQRRRHLVGQCARLGAPGHGRRHDGKFVAADAPHRAAAVDHRAQHAGHLAQQVVAGGVARRVVDGLEVVQVDQQQCQLAAVGAPLGDGLLQQAVAGAPVRQRRHLVGVGQVIEFALGRHHARAGAARQQLGQQQRAQRGEHQQAEVMGHGFADAAGAVHQHHLAQRLAAVLDGRGLLRAVQPVQALALGHRQLAVNAVVREQQAALVVHRHPLEVRRRAQGAQRVGCGVAVAEHQRRGQVVGHDGGLHPRFAVQGVVQRQHLVHQQHHARHDQRGHGG
nr:hypothetical protein [Massilia sp. Root418]